MTYSSGVMRLVMLGKRFLATLSRMILCLKLTSRGFVHCDGRYDLQVLEYESANGIDSLDELIQNARKLNEERMKKREGTCTSCTSTSCTNTIVAYEYRN